MKASVMKIDRTGPSVRAALAVLAPEECARFEDEFRAALAAAEDDFDAQPVQDVIGRWWARAHALSSPDPAADAAWDRIKAGDYSDVVEEWRTQEDGSYRVYRGTEGEWGYSHSLDGSRS